LLALSERGGHGDLRALDRLSIIHYVYGRTELYCAQACLTCAFPFLTLSKWRSPEPFIVQGRVVYNEPQCPTGGLGVGEPYTVCHKGQE
jgi:hypothetical protein